MEARGLAQRLVSVADPFCETPFQIQQLVRQFKLWLSSVG